MTAGDATSWVGNLQLLAQGAAATWPETGVWGWLAGAAIALLLGCCLLRGGAGRRRLAAGGLATLAGCAVAILFLERFPAMVALAAGTILVAAALFVIVQFYGPRRWWGLVTGGLGTVLLLAAIGKSVGWEGLSASWEMAFFWLLAAVTLSAAVATISSRSPIHSAIWFALTLLGVGGWMLLQGAQFLAVATVAVYAGAIVVTFLFVLMLAQPEGQAFYDRVSWGRVPMLMAAGSGALLVGLVALGLSRSSPPSVDPQWVATIRQTLQQQPVPRQLRHVRMERQRDQQRLRVVVSQPAGPTDAPPTAAGPAELDQLEAALASRLASLDSLFDPGQFGQQGAIQLLVTDADVMGRHHVAMLGRELFGRHLVAVEVAGVLLYLALVGAVAIASVPAASPVASPGART